MTHWRDDIMPQPTHFLVLSSPAHYYSTCFYCGTKLDYRKKRELPPNKATKDHVIPSDRRKLVPCCFDCNQRKRNLLLPEWRIVFFGGHGGEFHHEIRAREYHHNM